MPQKKKNPIHYYIMFATALIIMLATKYTSTKIWDKLQLQIEDTMQLACEQNALSTEKELMAKQSLLRGIAKQLPNNPSTKKDQVIKILQPFTEINGLVLLIHLDWLIQQTGIRVICLPLKISRQVFREKPILLTLLKIPLAMMDQSMCSASRSITKMAI